MGARDRLDSVYAELLELESNSGLLLVHAGDLVEATGLSRWLQPTSKRCVPRLTDAMRAAYLLRKLEWYDYMASSGLDEETRAHRAVGLASLPTRPDLRPKTLDDEGRFSLDRYSELLEERAKWSRAKKAATEARRLPNLSPKSKKAIELIDAEPVWPDIAAIEKAIEHGHTVDRVTAIRADPKHPRYVPRVGRPHLLTVRSESGVWQDKADRLRGQLTAGFLPGPDEPADEWVRRAGQRVKEWRRSPKYRLLESRAHKLT